MVDTLFGSSTNPDHPLSAVFALDPDQPSLGHDGLQTRSGFEITD